MPARALAHPGMIRMNTVDRHINKLASHIFSNNERNTAHYSNAAFSPFGLRLALLPMNAVLTQQVCADFQKHDSLPLRIKRFKDA